MEKEITGKISKITLPVSKTFTKRDGSSFSVWSIGVNIKNEWHNIKSDSAEGTKQFLFSSKLNRGFQVGDEVRIFLQPEDKEGKYWKIKAIVPYVPTDDVPIEEIEDAPKKEDGTLTSPLQKEGILTTVAKTGGIKIDNGDWINPTAVVKQQISADPSVLEDLKTKRGSRVEVIFNPEKPDTYEAVKVLEEQPQKQVNPKQEYKPNDSSYKAMAASYAKDLVIADKIKIDEMLDMAEKIFSYIMG